jgi:acetoin utilization protein AcuB
MIIKQYMSSNIITANPHDGLRQTFYRMRERTIHHMPVIGEKGEIVGIISDRDLRRPDWVDEEENVAHYYLLDNAHQVEGAMTRNPYVVHAEDNIQRAVELIMEHRCGALPVINDEQKVVGMISATDCLRAFHDVDQ